MTIKAVVVTALLNMILQAQTAVAPEALPPWITAAASLTLQGGMAIVIVVLWKAYQAKDILLVKSTEAVTSALAGQTSSNVELRGIIKDSVEANRSLKDAVERLRLTIERNGK
jgi:hypothetical protein